MSRTEGAVFGAAASALAAAALLPLEVLSVDLVKTLAAGEAAAPAPLASPRLWILLATSLLRAAAITAAALAVGVPLGLLVAHTDAPGRRTAFALASYRGVNASASLSRGRSSLSPELCSWDEPLANLDPVRRTELLAVFRTVLRARETAAVYVTHDVRELAGLADRVTDTRL